MQILIAPDKFKSSLTALEVCQAIDEGLKRSGLNSVNTFFPLADGGDGTAEILRYHTQGTWLKMAVKNALHEPVNSQYALSGDGQMAMIEMASASGLAFIPPEKRNVMESSTFGTGELILDAVNRGVKEIILGIGGSATNDGGIGMAAALGYRFLDNNGQNLEPVAASLSSIYKIIIPDLINNHHLKIRVACDVDNPLCGPQGASAVYGPQKGASPEEVQQLDQGLENLAKVVAGYKSGNLENVPGSGAAGGLGFGAMAFLDAELVSGIELVMEITRFREKLNNCNLIITGEGKIDQQTLSGKVIKGITSEAGIRSIPTYALCGSLEADPELIEGLGLVYAASVINRPMSLEEALASGYEAVKFHAFQLGRLLKEN